ncbi:MAG: SDR family NAD(P)-dependent oxidoreductase, partial [Acidobacteriota bacterium]
MSQDSFSPSSLDGLRVAVTGGTSGLGLALVEALNRGGARVAFVARDASRVQDVVRRFVGTHGIAGDVSSKEQTHRLAMRITAALGGLDVLIHNASSLGPVPLALLADSECEDFETALATNLVAQNPKTPKPQNPKTPKPQNPKTPKPQ